jgi:hypothetical protein
MAYQSMNEEILNGIMDGSLNKLKAREGGSHQNQNAHLNRLRGGGSNDMLSPMTTTPVPRVSLMEPPSVLAQKRTAKHINQFIRINVCFEGKAAFWLTIDRAMTVDYISKLLEAEYFHRFSLNHENQTNLFQLSQIYGPGSLPLPYSEVIGELVAFDDPIFPVGVPPVLQKRLDSK